MDAWSYSSKEREIFIKENTADPILMICLLGSLIFKFIIFIDFFFLSDHDYCYFRAILILYDINCFYFAKGQHFCISGNLRSKCYFQCFSCFVLHVVWLRRRPGWMGVLWKRSADRCGSSPASDIPEVRNHCLQLLPELGGHWRKENLCVDSWCRSAEARAWEVT